MKARANWLVPRLGDILLSLLLLHPASGMSAQDSVPGTYQLFISPKWNGKEHSIEPLRQAIQDKLGEPAMAASTGKPDLEVRISFECERALVTTPSGQHLTLGLVGTLTLNQSAPKPAKLAVPLKAERWLKINSEGSSFPQRMAFTNYDIAQEVCKKVKGGFPEDDLWTSATPTLADQTADLIRVARQWMRDGSLQGVEPLLKHEEPSLRESLVAFLGQVNSEDARAVLRRISTEDTYESIRVKAKEALAKTKPTKAGSGRTKGTSEPGNTQRSR